MADVAYTPEEIVEVYWVTTIANPAAPTVTELNAGTRLTDFLTDGPPSPSGSNFVNAGTLASGFEAQVASTYGGGQGTMTIRRKRDTTAPGKDSADTVFTLLANGTVGYLVTADYGTTGTPPARFGVGDDVCVYTVQVGNRGKTTTRGSLMDSPIDIAFLEEPHINVAVTSGA